MSGLLLVDNESKIVSFDSRYTASNSHIATVTLLTTFPVRADQRDSELYAALRGLERNKL